MTGPGERMALGLLVGGGGYLALDDKGCPRALQGNSQEAEVAVGIARFVRGGSY
jgi:hypothetical protein